MRRQRSSERGFILGIAFVLAILFFALVELQLLESSRALKEAHRFRAKIVAGAMAENGAELAAERMLQQQSHEAARTTKDGKFSGRYARSEDSFTIEAKGSAAGVAPAESTLLLEGRIRGNRIAIDYARYSQ